MIVISFKRMVVIAALMIIVWAGIALYDYIKKKREGG
jgi:hypothetical protein